MNRLDKKLRIYVIDDGVDSDGNSIAIKHYLNEDDSNNAMFKCYFRTLSTAERRSQYYLGEDSEVQFEVNQRKLNTNCYIEFHRALFGLETFKINYIDGFDDSNRLRLRIRAKKIIPPNFSAIKWGAKI